MDFTGRCLLLVQLCVILHFTLSSSSYINDLREATFYKRKGKSLFGNVTERHRTKDFLDCSFLCVNAEKKNCFSFNFGGTKIQELQDCELSSSEIKLNPGNQLQDRQGFDYYGMTEKSLNSYLPCASSPCNHGKECITKPFGGLYSCRCPLENVVRFTDDTCNFDVQQINKITDMVAGVQLTRFKERTLNFYESEKLCKLLNATMASYDQLYAAWNASLDLCIYGWINSGRIAFPIQNANPGCGNRVGIILSGIRDMFNERFPVWCYSQQGFGARGESDGP